MTQPSINNDVLRGIGRAFSRTPEQNDPVNDFYRDYFVFSVQQRLFTDTCRQLYESEDPADVKQQLLDECHRLSVIVADLSQGIIDTIPSIIKLMSSRKDRDDETLDLLTFASNIAHEDGESSSAFALAITSKELGIKRRPRTPQIANPFIMTEEEQALEDAYEALPHDDYVPPEGRFSGAKPQYPPAEDDDESEDDAVPEEEEDSDAEEPEAESADTDDEGTEEESDGSDGDDEPDGDGDPESEEGEDDETESDDEGPQSCRCNDMERNGKLEAEEETDESEPDGEDDEESEGDPDAGDVFYTPSPKPESNPYAEETEAILMGNGEDEEERYGAGPSESAIHRLSPRRKR
ncbi:MAG: hypothetical protein E7Z63_00905 [Thermoplasmata archaeon]|nr:hypothetical protein [Thermoplasmata archaeon]